MTKLCISSLISSSNEAAVCIKGISISNGTVVSVLEFALSIITIVPVAEPTFVVVDGVSTKVSILSFKSELDTVQNSMSSKISLSVESLFMSKHCILFLISFSNFAAV